MIPPVPFLPDGVRLWRNVRPEGINVAFVHDRVSWSTSFRHRRVCQFGAAYAYDGDDAPPASFPSWLRSVADVVDDLVGQRSNNCIANAYVADEGRMGWHADDVAQLAADAGVAILSVGGPCRFRLRHVDTKDDVIDIRLVDNALLWVPNAIHVDWQHAVDHVEGDRVSLSFRQLT